jgi:PAS domain S-box/diguanylate cyclase (GGDEF) domain
VEVNTIRVQVGESWKHLSLVRNITERRRIETELRIAAIAFESAESMMVTDALTRILRVNRAFVASTGYSEEEVLGQTPRILKSGRHDSAFYRAMWEELAANGSWQGEIWDRRKNGEVYPKWLTITAVRDREGRVTHYVGSHTDITERKSAEEAIRTLAFHDPLTGLPNRRLFFDRLDRALSAAARYGRRGALIFVDIDNFKVLNDTRGHAQGDDLLLHVGRRLKEIVRAVDTVARLGGDEFVVMAENLSPDLPGASREAEHLAGKIVASLREPIRWSPLPTGRPRAWGSPSSTGRRAVGRRSCGRPISPCTRPSAPEKAPSGSSIPGWSRRSGRGRLLPRIFRRPSKGASFVSSISPRRILRGKSAGRRPCCAGSTPFGESSGPTGSSRRRRSRG